MSTTQKPLKYLWSAVMEDGFVINQPFDDRYSKHDDNAEWNPSAFRDILEYDKPVSIFMLYEPFTASVWSLNLHTGTFYHNGVKTLQKRAVKPTEPKLVYYRNVEQNYIDGEAQEPEVVEYCFGFEYKKKDGTNGQKLVTLDGR